uniref:Uncharacterized protein n=1 Tax=Cacopsylla melanoneura TaxID=428564 RepID=A0A8D8XJ93_9HEMI
MAIIGDYGKYNMDGLILHSKQEKNQTLSFLLNQFCFLQNQNNSVEPKHNKEHHFCMIRAESYRLVAKPCLLHAKPGLADIIYPATKKTSFYEATNTTQTLVPCQYTLHIGFGQLSNIHTVLFHTD